MQITLQKSAVLGGPVKKTYLTLVYLTVVSANKTKGFIAEKNRFREAVKNRASLLNWADVDAVSRKVESKGGIYFTTENTKSTEK